MAKRAHSLQVAKVAESLEVLINDQLTLLTPTVPSYMYYGRAFT